MKAGQLLLAAAFLLLAAPGWAQSEGGSAGEAPRSATTSASSAKPNNFDSLSAGDRKIARALFLAQHPTAKGPAPLSLNQIADLKSSDSWAKVFKQMQSQGLLQAKSLGQIVEGYEHQRRSDRGPAREATARAHGSRTIIVTNGQGDVVASTRNRSAGVAHGGDEVVEANAAAVARADKPERPDRPDRRR